jgi:hypothetical protein
MRRNDHVFLKTAPAWRLTTNPNLLGTAEADALIRIDRVMAVETPYFHK